MNAALRAPLVALMCLAFAAAGLIASAPAKADDGSCAQVTVFGFRGEDREESYLATQHKLTNSGDNFGALTTLYADALKAALPSGVTVRYVGVPYVLSAIRTEHPAAPATYRTAIETAKAAATDSITHALSACPDTAAVLIGFGEGAQVAHEALTSIKSAQLRRIAAVVLLSDPIRVATDPVERTFSGQGVAPPSQGGDMITYVSQAPGEKDPALDYAPRSALLPPDLSGRVRSVCPFTDFYCAANSGAIDDPFRPYISDSAYVQPTAQWAAAEAQNLCSDVTFFGARGSGEGTADGTPTQPDAKRATLFPGFGDTLATLAYNIEDRFSQNSGISFGFVPVDYMAIDVGGALQFPSRYPTSVLSGTKANAGPSQFRDLIARCPDTKVVMLGYSQGGQVIHEVTMSLSPEERQHIAAVVLVADASRNPADMASTVTFIGKPLTQFSVDGAMINNGLGAMRLVAQADRSCLALSSVAESIVHSVASFFTMASPLPQLVFCSVVPTDVRFSDVVTTRTFPADVSGKVLNVCSTQDLVCDAHNTGVGDFGTADVLGMSLDALKGIQVPTVHVNGYKNLDFYNFPSSWAAQRIEMTSG